MAILFLDDDSNRRKRFQAQVPDATLVETADEAITALRDNSPWDEVWLDHDLGGEVYVDPNRPNTGSEVVRWIQEHRPTVNRFWVHSLNSAAAHRMVENLRDFGYTADRTDWVLSKALQINPY